jgi:hypothetical protein
VPPPNGAPMAALFTLIPVGLVLGLLMFGTYGTHRPPAITPGRVIPVALLTVLLGPATAAALGLFGWLAVMLALLAVMLMIAMLRNPPLRS